MSDCAARPRWAARRRVLSRPDSRAIEDPCVLALHSPIPPARRASFRFDLLAREVAPRAGVVRPANRRDAHAMGGVGRFELPVVPEIDRDALGIAGRAEE